MFTQFCSHMRCVRWCTALGQLPSYGVVRQDIVDSYSQWPGGEERGEERGEEGRGRGREGRGERREGMGRDKEESGMGWKEHTVAGAGNVKVWGIG